MGTLSPLSLYTPATPGGLLFGGTPALGTSASSTYCLPADAIALFPLLSNIDPAMVAAAVINATWYIENFTQRRFFPTSYTEEVALIVAKRSKILGKVRNYPVIAISDIRWRTTDSDDWTIGDPTKADIAKTPSRLIYYRGPVNVYTGTQGDLQMTYVAGFQPVPGDIVLAAQLLTVAFAMRAANPMGALSISSTVEGAANSLGLAAKSVHQADAEDILSKYVRWE